jgi:hypothetical protein
MMNQRWERTVMDYGDITKNAFKGLPIVAFLVIQRIALDCKIDVKKATSSLSELHNVNMDNLHQQTKDPLILGAADKILTFQESIAGKAFQQVNSINKKLSLGNIGIAEINFVSEFLSYCPYSCGYLECDLNLLRASVFRLYETCSRIARVNCITYEDKTTHFKGLDIAYCLGITRKFHNEHLTLSSN